MTLDVSDQEDFSGYQIHKVRFIEKVTIKFHGQAAIKFNERTTNE